MENGEIHARGNGMLTSGCFLNRSLPVIQFKPLPRPGTTKLKRLHAVERRPSRGTALAF